MPRLEPFGLADGNIYGLVRRVPNISSLPLSIARSIAAKWKSLSKEDRIIFDQMAAEDKKRYQSEMEGWKQQQQEKQGDEPPTELRPLGRPSLSAAFFVHGPLDSRGLRTMYEHPVFLDAAVTGSGHHHFGSLRDTFKGPVPQSLDHDERKMSTDLVSLNDLMTSARPTHFHNAAFPEQRQQQQQQRHQLQYQKHQRQQQHQSRAEQEGIKDLAERLDEEGNTESFLRIFGGSM